LGGRGRRISEFEASLLYRVSSRTARLYRETLSRKTKERKKGRKEGRKKEKCCVYGHMGAMACVWRS
jgi:predicted transposase YdaD